MSCDQDPRKVLRNSRMTYHAPVMALSQNDLASTIGETLRRVFGTERHASKRLAQITGASNRSAENWIAGENAPDAFHLLRLMATVPELASEIRRLTAMTDTDPEFARDFARAMRTFQRVQEMRNATMAMDAGDVARGGDAASARPPREPARGHGDGLDAAPLPMVGPPQ
jgi:hypothetical protein